MVIFRFWPYFLTSTRKKAFFPWPTLNRKGLKPSLLRAKGVSGQADCQVNFL
jgi:hypothetical protein